MITKQEIASPACFVEYIFIRRLLVDDCAIYHSVKEPISMYLLNRVWGLVLYCHVYYRKNLPFRAETQQREHD